MRKLLVHNFKIYYRDLHKIHLSILYENIPCRKLLECPQLHQFNIQGFLKHGYILLYLSVVLCKCIIISIGVHCLNYCFATLILKFRDIQYNSIRMLIRIKRDSYLK